MTKSKIFLYLCLSFIGGIFISSMFFIPQIFLWGFLFFGFLLVFILFFLFPERKFFLAGFYIFFLVIGIWRYQISELKILNNELRKYNNREKIITLTGIINEEPVVKETIVKLKVKASQIEENNNIRDIKENVLITVNKYPEYRYGDKLKITGKIESPPVFKEFNYQKYLKKEGIYSVMSWPEIELLGQGFGNPIYKILFSFKNKFKETSRNFISPPQEGILEALIFGDEENISEKWKEKLNLTGTRHIAAVSGMNITIISALILTFFITFGFWRSQTFYFSIIMIIFYILMIGAPASAVRAGIMGCLFLIAQYFGRLSTASRAVVFACAIMVFFNPFILMLDIGFQLSFLAIMGIIYLQPFFSKILKKLPNPDFFPVRTTLATSLSAQFFTLPVLIYNFGYFSLISPFANILIVPFLAPITVFIFIFGLFGSIFHFLGFVLFFPAWLSLTYITKIIGFLAEIPFSSLNFDNIHWFWLIIFYLILGLAIRRFNEKQKLKFLNY